MANPLLCLGSSRFPLFDEIKPEHVVPAYRELIGRLERELGEVEQRAATCDWDALVYPLEKITDELDTIWNVVRLLKHVKDSISLRAAIQAVQGERVSFEVKLKQSKELFEAFKAIHDSTSFATLGQSRKLIVKSQLRNAVLNGTSLGETTKERFSEIEQELELLSEKFNQNVIDSRKQYQKLVTEVYQVEGLPHTVLQAAANAAVSKGYEGASPERGPWMFNFGPTYGSVMTNAKDRALREELYLARITVASEGDFDNTPVINRTLELRQEKAKLLGFQNYAEVAMLHNMATPQTARNMLEELISACREESVKELAKLKSLKEAPRDLRPWDILYLKHLHANSDFRQDDARPFLPLPNVLDVLFALSNELFQVEVEEADELAPVWHEDVKFFVLKNCRDGEHIAYFYLDPFARPGKRPGVSWMTDILKSRVFVPQGSSVRLPAVAMICNMMPPSLPDEPALLSFNEVRTLFHEFGHALQHMLTSRGLLRGNQEFDAVELPSQFMENWCYQRSVISRFAYHYKTKEPLPDSMYGHLMAARRVQLQPMALQNKLHMALVDLELHTSFCLGGTETVHDFEARFARWSCPYPGIPQDRFLCSFIHIFTSSGYAAGFYSYIWAELLSEDAFGAFEECGLDNGKDVELLGRRFRDTVLSLAGTRPALEEFRGREPDSGALARKYGLLQGSN